MMGWRRRATRGSKRYDKISDSDDDEIGRLGLSNHDHVDL